MTTYGGICDPSRQREKSLDICSRLGPTKGAPTPPGGQMDATNKRYRNSCTQNSAGVKQDWHGIWADPKGRGGRGDSGGPGKR